MCVPLLVLFVFFHGVFLHSSTGACSATTDFIMQVNVRRTTTTPSLPLEFLVGEKAVVILYQTYNSSSSTSKTTASHEIHIHARTAATGRRAVLHHRSNCPSVIRHSARSTHTPRSVGWEGELPTACMPGSSAVLGGPIRRNTRSPSFHSYCFIADY